MHVQYVDVCVCVYMQLRLSAEAETFCLSFSSFRCISHAACRAMGEESRALVIAFLQADLTHRLGCMHGGVAAVRAHPFFAG
jgi:hypothetical protein